MLLIYLEPFAQAQTQSLNLWTPWVHYWPRSWAHTDAYNSAVPLDWWLLFSNPSLASIWMMKYPEHTRVARNLD